jgi:hypothetical protein
MKQELTEEIFDIIRDRVIHPKYISKSKKVSFEAIDTILSYVLWLDIDASKQIDEFNEQLSLLRISEFTPNSLKDHRHVINLLDTYEISSRSHIQELDENIAFLKEQIGNLITA